MLANRWRVVPVPRGCPRWILRVLSRAYRPGVTAPGSPVHEIGLPRGAGGSGESLPDSDNPGYRRGETWVWGPSCVAFSSS